MQEKSARDTPDAAIGELVASIEWAGLTIPREQADGNTTGGMSVGTVEELREVLESLRPFMRKRQPKPGRPYIEQLQSKQWPAESFTYESPHHTLEAL